MRLTWRDGVTTLLALVVVGITLAVTQGWDWPLVGSMRAGMLALGIAGIAMCSVGTRSEDMAARETFASHPGMWLGSALGVVALAIFVIGMIVDTEAWLVAMALTLLALWIVASVRHAFVPATAQAVGAH